MSVFKLHSPFKPSGDQPKAIKELLQGRPGNSTLMGVTGSGKTFTMANVIAKQNKPVLVLSPNKTLAAQLYEEFSLFFPKNKVCYFVSYYDYYQPESYMPAQDIYVPKETKINAELERLRIEATASIINRPDTIVVASISCIYSLGNPTDYKNLAFSLKVGQKISRTDLVRKLIFIQYVRNDIELSTGQFRVRGGTIEVNLPYQKEKLVIDMFGDRIESLCWVSKLDNIKKMDLDNTLIFPAKHFVATKEKQEAAIKSISAELNAVLPTMKNPIYKERLKARVFHDLEMLKEVGYCSGIENYSVHFDGRSTGEAPYSLMDFFGDDFLLMIDESHIAVPQFRGMYAGDRSRKKSLVEFGFRLPSALDNRPLCFEEVEKYFKNTVFISATPSEYELEKSGHVVEQIIRPTGLVDPKVITHPREGQVAHLIEQIQTTKEKGFRTLVTVLTKKLAEELAYYLEEKKIKVCYMHSEIKTPQRTEILHKLRTGVFDCVVGVNLLREGLDLPEVALVAIMDADVESFLRDKRSLVQTIGRAARNNESQVILYTDKITKSIKSAIDETDRRRKIQMDYNKKHGVVPVSVSREVTKSISKMQQAVADASTVTKRIRKKQEREKTDDVYARTLELEKQMKQAAEKFEFERAIELRNEWLKLKKI